MRALASTISTSVSSLRRAAKKHGRYGVRDATMILVAFRHGLRVSELCSLTWDQIDFSQGMMHVRRVKNGIASVQQIGGEELRALRALKREDVLVRQLRLFLDEAGHHRHQRAGDPMSG